MIMTFPQPLSAVKRAPHRRNLRTCLASSFGAAKFRFRFPQPLAMSLRRTRMRFRNCAGIETKYCSVTAVKIISPQTGWFFGNNELALWMCPDSGN
jgi:hypothetical protein